MPLDCYDTPDQPVAESRPYLGVLFECCGVYARIYRRPRCQAYYARCPKCLRTVRVRVAKDGVTARLFRAS
jgi:hypothetical protein